MNGCHLRQLNVKFWYSSEDTEPFIFQRSCCHVDHVDPWRAMKLLMFLSYTGNSCLRSSILSNVYRRTVMSSVYFDVLHYPHAQKFCNVRQHRFKFTLYKHFLRLMVILTLSLFSCHSLFIRGSFASQWPPQLFMLLLSQTGDFWNAASADLKLLGTCFAPGRCIHIIRCFFRMLILLTWITHKPISVRTNTSFRQTLGDNNIFLWQYVKCEREASMHGSCATLHRPIGLLSNSVQIFVSCFPGEVRQFNARRHFCKMFDLHSSYLKSLNAHV